MELVPPRDRKKLLNRIVSNTPGPVPLKGAIDALMSGNLGELFVDNADNPKAFVGCLDFVFLWGAPCPEMLEDVLRLYPKELVVIPLGCSQWSSATSEALADRGISKSIRFAMRQTERLGVASHALPPGLEVEKLEFDNLDALCRQVSPNFLRDFWPTSYWRQVGVCFGLKNKDGGYLAGAGAFAVGDKNLEIEIATREDQRQNGYATLLAAHLIRYSLDIGLTPCWDAANEVSCRLAQKLGYEMEGEYVCWRVGAKK